MAGGRVQGRSDIGDCWKCGMTTQAGAAFGRRLGKVYVNIPIGLARKDGHDDALWPSLDVGSVSQSLESSRNQERLSVATRMNARMVMRECGVEGNLSTEMG